MNVPLKRKYLGNGVEIARGWRYAGKKLPRQHSGNGLRRPKKNPSGLSVPSVNNTYMHVDGKTGKTRMRRYE